MHEVRKYAISIISLEKIKTTGYEPAAMGEIYLK